MNKLLRNAFVYKPPSSDYHEEIFLQSRQLGLYYILEEFSNPVTVWVMICMVTVHPSSFFMKSEEDTSAAQVYMMCTAL